jgi:hypothetical protein
MILKCACNQLTFCKRFQNLLLSADFETRSKESAAEVMLREVVGHLRTGTGLQEIQFVLFDNETLAAFERVLAKYKP